MFPDRNAARRNRQDEPVRQINYGQIKDIFHVKLHDHGDPDIPQVFLLARVLPCKILKGEDATKEVVEYKLLDKSPIIINLLTVDGTIGRVLRHKTWGIIDRSQNSVRTLFIGDDNAPVSND
jgi:hypothetical protein